MMYLWSLSMTEGIDIFDQIGIFPFQFATV